MSDFFGQFFDIAAANSALMRAWRLLQLDLNRLKVDHSVPLSRVLNLSL